MNTRDQPPSDTDEPMSTRDQPPSDTDEPMSTRDDMWSDTDEPMSTRDQPPSDTDEPSRSSTKEPIRVDPVSAVAGLVFIAAALLALIDGLVTDVDRVIVAGAATAAVGVAMIGRVIMRHRRRGRGHV